MSGEVEDRREAEPSGKSVGERFAQRVTMVVPHRHNEKLRRVIELVNADDELYGLWVASNVVAIDRLGISDHGPVHVKIVMNLSVRMLRLLVDHEVRPSLVSDYGLTTQDAELVVALAALFHDVGMSIHREDHEAFSLHIAEPKLKTILGELYPVPEATIMRSEILHAIIAHRSGGQPLTLEAGVVRIADALDMAKGRSRIPFESGSVSIHSISAAAIEAVRIDPGAEKAVRIVIEMSNSAGVFQLDELFRRKLDGSGLEAYVELEARLVGDEEKRLLDRYEL